MMSGRWIQFSALDAWRRVAALGVALFHFFRGGRGIWPSISFRVERFHPFAWLLVWDRKTEAEGVLVHRLARLYLCMRMLWLCLWRWLIGCTGSGPATPTVPCSPSFSIFCC